MSLLGSIGHFLGFGNNDDPKKKKQQQTIQPAQNPGTIFAPTKQSSPLAPAPTSVQPDNGVNLALPQKTPGTKTGSPVTLQKPTPATPTPAPTIAPVAPAKVSTNQYGGSNAGVTTLVKAKPKNPLGPNAATGPTDWRGVARGTTAAPVSTAIDVAKGITGLVDLLPGKGDNFATKALTKANKKVSNFVGDSPDAQDAFGMAKTALAPATLIGPGEISGAIRGTRALEDISSEVPRIVTGLQKGKAAATNAADTVRSIGSKLRKPVAVDAPIQPDEAAPGIRSANPNQVDDAAAQVAQQTPPPAPVTVSSADDIPAFQRRPQTPQTVGRAITQYKTGVPIPDEVFSADARAANAPVIPENPSLDIPTFMRNNPDVATGVTNLAKASSRTQALERSGTQSAKFDQKQEIAKAFQQSPSKGRAVAALLKHRAEITKDPNALRDAVVAQNEAERDLHMRQAAADAANNPVPTDVPAPAAPVTPELSPAPAPASGSLPDAPAPAEPTVADLAGQGARPANTIQKAIEDAHNAGDDAKAAQLVEMLPEDLKQPMRSALGLPAAPVAPAVPTIPDLPTQTVDVAPRTHDQIVQQLGDVGGDLKGKYSQREQVNLDDAKEKATGLIANMSDDDVLKAFQGADPNTMITDAKSFAVARAALGRLSKMSADDPAAVQQVTNIMNAMDNATSKGGEIMRAAQEEFDTMPVAMKVRYLVKKIDAANRETKDYDPLSRNPDRADLIEAILSSHLNKSQNIAEGISALESKAEKAAEDARNGVKNTTDLKAIRSKLNADKLDLQKSNGELVKYFQDQVPGRTSAQKTLVDFPRRMMLASGTGRANDIITTSANVVHHQATGLVQGLLAKGVNLVKPGKVTDRSRGMGKVFSGAVQGLRKTVGEVKGNQYIPDVQKSIRSNEDMRSGLQKARGPVGRTIQAATEAATNLTEGIRDQRVVQLARQEGQKLGLAGDDLARYTDARSTVPSRQMLEAANEIHKQVNNLNDNPLTRKLNQVSSAIGGNSVAGGILKNQVMPFTSWLGGNIWNSVTDKNVVASAIKFGRDVVKGDPEGAVENLSKTITGAAQAYGLGYVLTKSGMLTNTNAEGYNDAGVYLHVGDRYIPAGFLGFWAPNIILGNAAYEGINNYGDKNPAVAIGENIANNSIQSFNVNGALGTDTNLSRAMDTFKSPTGGLEAAGAQTIGGVAGQFIPGATGDVNAVLDNGLKLGGKTIVPDNLNPNHEKADTKVVNPNSKSGTAKDFTKSAGASFVNRLPFASQGLPRKAGVAANDLFDRTDHGDRATSTEKQAATDAKTVADTQAENKKKGIPDPSIKYEKGDSFEQAVENRVENKKYDQAIAGLEQQLTAKQKAADSTDKTVQPIKDQIAQVKVLKDGKFDPTIRDTYKSTSVSEWRDMGDPKSDTYDPDTYQKLYDYDTALAKAGVSGSTLKKTDNKFTAKKASTGGKGDSATAKTKSNTLGSTPELGRVSFGDLAPQKAGSIKIPTISQIKPGDLIKKRTISIGKS